MGTRNLTCVVVDGEMKVAQYCQWDGYPSGQGRTVLEFLKNTDLEKFRPAVRNCTFIGDEAIAEKWKSVGADDSGWVNMEISDKFQKKYPELHRNTGADILALIQAYNGLELYDDHEFAADGLFCEWAYVIDLDQNVLEVYEGFCKSDFPTEGRFKDLTPGTEGYSPVTLVATYPLDDLPSVEDFCRTLDPEE